VRVLILALALIALPAHAQEKEKKKAAPKKPAAASHQKATPEQIRKFNELQKKQGK
jgi:hypothetical protein